MTEPDAPARRTDPACPMCAADVCSVHDPRSQGAAPVLFTDVVTLDGTLPLALDVLSRVEAVRPGRRFTDEEWDALRWLHTRLMWGRDRALSGA